MAPQFNLLAGRFDTMSPIGNWAWGAAWVQGGRTYVVLYVRGGRVSYVARRRVRAYEPVEFN